MSTERANADQIISSGTQENTVRISNSIISSEISNPQIITSSLADEIILNGVKYTIEKQIARSGEAEVFLINSNSQKSVFKYYYSQYKPKDEILNKLKGLKHPDIVCLFDFGYYQDRFFEISEYAEGGTLQEVMPITSSKKIKAIVEEIIEALNYCHTHGIIHRDIKPENIFYKTSEKLDIAIGDFGIASNIKEGEELVRTSIARTTIYAPPELFTSIQGKTTIEKSVDYYALGMTLLHLWFGKNPFEDVDEFGIMRLKSEGRVLFPDNIDSEVEQLIKGLITVNPRDRWAYDEVKRWLKGEDVKVHYQTIQFEYKPYSFGLIDGEQIVVNTPKDLANYLEKYPEKGEGHLYRNTIAKWIEPIDPGLFNELMDIVEKDFPRDKTAGLTKATYILDPERPFRGADKTKLKTQEEIASYFEQNFGHYEKDLQNPNAAFYVFLESRNFKEKADEYRNYFNITNAETALNTIIFKLQGADKYIVDNYAIYQPEELLQIDDNTKLHVINSLANINSKLSIWISSFKNLQSSIDKWRTLGRYDGITLRYALQQGFIFNGSVANNGSDFHNLFKDNFSNFFSSTHAAKNQIEANYWLKNFLKNSFCQAVINYLKSEKYSDTEFSQMIGYVLTDYNDAGLTLYNVIEKLLNEIKTRTSNNKQLFDKIVEIHAISIENFWVKDYKVQSLRFIDCLYNYIIFVEKNIGQYSNFLYQLTSQLDDRIAIDIRKDIELIKGNESHLTSYISDLAKVVDKLRKINLDLSYIKRYDSEIIFIQKQNKIIADKNAQEKQNKINITNNKYDEIVAKHQGDFNTAGKGKEFQKAFYWCMGVGLASLILLITALVNGPSAIGVIAIAFSLLGAAIAVYICVLTDTDLSWGVVIAIIVCAVIGYYLGKKIPIEAIYALSSISLLFFGGRSYYLLKQKDNSVKAIGLEPSEQAALKQSMNEINRYFIEKESNEKFIETARIVSLDKKQFENEMLGVRSK